jgi:hypothetical protein
VCNVVWNLSDTGSAIRVYPSPSINLDPQYETTGWFQLLKSEVHSAMDYETYRQPKHVIS